MIFPRYRRLLPSVFLAGALFPSCAGSSGDPAPLPAPSTILTVRAREYSFEVNGPLPAGRAVFRIVNAGRERHAPKLVVLDETSAPLGAQLQEAGRAPALATVNARLPGNTGAFAVDLEPGRRYALICRFSGPDGVSHAEKGMAWEARAGRSAAPRAR